MVENGLMDEKHSGKLYEGRGLNKIKIVVEGKFPIGADQIGVS